MAAVVSSTWALCFSACGPAGGPPSSFDGSVAGVSLTVADSVFVVVRDPNTKEPNQAIVLLSDRTEICDSLRKGVIPQQSTIAFFYFFSRGGPNLTPTAPLTPGEFTYQAMQAPGRTLLAALGKYGAACAPELGAEARSGTATISALQPSASGSLVASYRLGFATPAAPSPPGETVSGNLNARYCDVDGLVFAGGRLGCE